MWNLLKKLIQKPSLTKGVDMIQGNWVKVMFVDMTPIGSLQIFGVCTQQQAADNIDLSDKIYWLDYLATQPIGPFNNVYEAAKNHVSTVLSRRVYKDQILLANNSIFPESSSKTTVSPLNRNNVINIQDYKASKMKYNKPKANR